MRRRSGFTLIEVLIALAILAVSGMALVRQAGLSVTQLERLEQKNLALWLAENQLAEVRSLSTWPPTGRQSETLEKFDREWLVRAEVSNTPDPDLRKIEVAVAIIDEYGEENNLVFLTAYRGKH